MSSAIWIGLGLAPIVGALQGFIIKQYVGKGRDFSYTLTAIILSALVVLSSGWIFQDQAWLAVSILFGWWLIPLALIDFHILRLPNTLTIPLILLGLFATYYLQADQMLWHLMAAFVGAGLFFIVAHIFHKMREVEGLGMGDIKFVTGLGAWVGLSGLTTLIFLASILGIGFALVKRGRGKNLDKTVQIPFGTFLGVAGWTVWLFGPLEMAFFK